MTNHWTDMKNSDVVMICGCNPAEQHPCGFKWVVKAKERGATIISVDPRFTRTSAVADVYAPLRSGSDIAFTGGLINYIIQNERYHKDYVVNYTNAGTLIDEGFDFDDGFFTGYDADSRRYDRSTWIYQTDEHGNIMEDRTLQHPRTVFQLLKKHYSRYTPGMVSNVTGMPRELFLRIADLYTSTGAPDRTGTWMYAIGTTQHTIGTQMIRSYAMIQLLLGNIGRPGGGVNALRGHANVQGATDMAVLYHIIPGYMAQPLQATHPTFDDYIERETPATGWWVNKPKYFVSLLKAWFGDAATAANDFGYNWLGKRAKDYSHLPMFEDMHQGLIDGFVCLGQNPIVGGPNARIEREALHNLSWMLVIDHWEHETASFWKSENGADPAAIDTEVFFLPAAANWEKAGSFTNSGRWLQWKEKAADPLGDAHSDLAYVFQLGKRLKAHYAQGDNPRDDGIRALTWDYDEVEHLEPDIQQVIKEIHGFNIVDGTYDVRTGTVVNNFTGLQADGSTACGNWIYSGMLEADPDDPTKFHNKMENRTPDENLEDPDVAGSSLGWAWSWPVNRRILYNRASADLNGQPWGPRKAYMQWDAAEGRWMGPDIPDFAGTKAPDTPGIPLPEEEAAGLGFHSGTDPFIMFPDGRAHLFGGLNEGPFPEHYEPLEAPMENALSSVNFNPASPIMPSLEGHIGSIDEYPIIISTYRLTEHHLTGVMTRNLPWLAALMPELFLELSPQLASEKGIVTGDTVEIRTARGRVEARALITKRFQPYRIDGRIVHQVGIPWHWGFQGIATGDIVNLLTPNVGDANTTIQESKAFLCDIAKVASANGDETEAAGGA
jgi:formate dehydrogenase-N alpha subunit